MVKHHPLSSANAVDNCWIVNVTREIRFICFWKTRCQASLHFFLLYFIITFRCISCWKLIIYPFYSSSSGHSLSLMYSMAFTFCQKMLDYWIICVAMELLLVLEAISSLFHSSISSFSSVRNWPILGAVVKWAIVILQSYNYVNWFFPRFCALYQLKYNFNIPKNTI